ncbi:MAG: A/G-specific adenine glycosylase [Saprospiraceae bacterium]|nr:A/G-specific adenine glycosylase [Saprospiraceae bacterium]
MQIEAERLVNFRQQLMEWYELSHRPLPWKGEKNPYLIWLSEIILQQTRVEQGLPYFELFRNAYPTLQDLAAADEDEVMKLWEGLGYYSRARNMHSTAKHIAYERAGQFPNTYEEILALKGVGPYTAAAIVSFAYDLPHAVVDGNVYRVLARFFGIEIPTDSTEGKKLFNDLAQQALDATQPGRYNQAIMDFGATQCTPQNPDCKNCPLQADCQAFEYNTVEMLPVKSKKLVKRERYFHYLVIQSADKTIVRKRIEKDIWQNLYEFPMIELSEPATDFGDLKNAEFWNYLLSDCNYKLLHISRPFKQILTHQVIHALFFEIEILNPHLPEDSQFVVTERKNLSKFAFPKIIDWYLQDNSLYLNLL